MRAVQRNPISMNNISLQNGPGGKSSLARAVATKSALGKNVSHARRNFRLGVISGTMGGASNDFLHPELILAGFVYVLTGSTFAVAVVSVLNKAGIMIPQLVVGNMVESFSRRRPAYVIAAVVRLGSAAMMVASMAMLARFNGPVSLALFCSAVFFHAASKGSLGILNNDMIGRLIPPHRVGALLGARKLLGGMMAILAGAAVIQPILSAVVFPYDYLILMIIGTLILIAEMTAWCLCREQPGHRSKRRTSLPDAVRRGVEWIKTDWNYRCYMWIRISFRFSYVGLAFFIPYGTESLGYGVGAGGLAVLGGILVAVRKISELTASPFWARIADTRGHRAALIGSSALTLTAPVIALTAARMPVLFELDVPGFAYPVNLPLVVFLLALACLGAGFSGMIIAGQQFLITSAPAEHRPSYMAFINTLITPLTFLPLAGAALAGALGMNVLFMLVAAGASIGVFAAIRMRKPADAVG